jgi:N-acetylglucosaminyl-diphospho-decaprenol L-rhamnosyltransferase
VLDQTGGFDEQFFMYAEDIDLSYRIDKAGFKNYYLPATTIIHFKGESTQKDIRYVKMFYSAMQLFMKKHFNKKGNSARLYVLNLGLRLRQALAFIRLPFKKPAFGKTGIPVFIKGNPGNEEKIKQKLAGYHMPVSEVEKKAGAIIFYENDSFSWKTIIAEIRSQPQRHLYYFHGAGTHAIVGSHSDRKQGQIIEL